MKKYENLFVCDCSVIPEPWGLPPALTIICQASVTAKHLLSGKQSVPARIAKRIKEKLRN